MNSIELTQIKSNENANSLNANKHHSICRTHQQSSLALYSDDDAEKCG